MQRLLTLFAMTVVCAAAARPAAAQDFAECSFGFSVNAESSALQALVDKAAGKGGFWLSISEAPPDVRRIARHVGRLQVCLSTPDGKPRAITRGGQTVTLESPFVTNCTATLLPDNRLLTNNHCYYDPDLVRAGFSIVQEARVNFDYTSRDLTDSVATYRVAPRELAVDLDVDALVLQVIGDPNSDLGGHFPLRMTQDIAPLQDLVMIHHPGAQPQQYSTGTCKVHRRQDEVSDRASALRHTCETTGGSSGALLLDARTLAVVALHNQGGLRSTGDGFNGGHKIGTVNERLELGFEQVTAALGPGPDFAANRALADALLIPEDAERLAALRALETRFAGTEISAKARDAALRTEAALERARDAEETALRQKALSALTSALVQAKPADRIAALEAVIERFGGTDAAERAAQAINRERSEQALSREREIAERERLADAARVRSAADADAAQMQAALQALTDAMLIAEPEAQRAALLAVTAEFAESPAAERAKEALDRLEATLQRNTRNAEAEQRQAALAALTEALLIADPEARQLALAAVPRDFPDTEAAQKAGAALERLAGARATQPVDREARVAQARLRCALRAGSPFDPARPESLPGIALEKIDADQAIASCSHPDTQINSSPGTSFALARAYEANGEYAEAQSFYRLAHSAGYTAATTALGRFARDGHAGKADLEQAIGFFEASAEAGDPVAMTFLAAIYENEGGAVRRDYASATRYLEQAIVLGHPHALFAKAEAYRNGTLYQKDLHKALEFYERAAAAGDTRALFEEAMIYLRGEAGVIEADKPRALELLVVAAEAGSRRAQHRIGTTYLYGLKELVAGVEVAPDFVKAKRWLGLAAENGYVQAQMQLGKIFELGSFGVKMDLAEALYWYELGAKQDFVEGLVQTARMYEFGQGTDADPEKSAAYWLRSMEMGSWEPQRRTDKWEQATAEALQRLLRDKGVYRGGIDGAIGPGSIEAIKAYTDRHVRNLSYLDPGVRIERANVGWLCQC